MERMPIAHQGGGGVIAFRIGMVGVAARARGGTRQRLRSFGVRRVSGTNAPFGDDMSSTLTKVSAWMAATVVALSVSACSSSPQSEAMATRTTAPSADEAVAGVESPESFAAHIGSRDNPLPVGQVLAFSAESAFKVGAWGPTQISPTFSILPVVIQIDWANFNGQAIELGQPTGSPVKLVSNFGISFVTATGKSYATWDDYTTNVGDLLWNMGDVHEGTDVINANFAVSVPEAEVHGGTWVIEDYSSGARVFIDLQ